MCSLGNERVLRRAIILDSILHSISLRPEHETKIQIKINMNDDPRTQYYFNDMGDAHATAPCDRRRCHFGWHRRPNGQWTIGPTSIRSSHNNHNNDGGKMKMFFVACHATAYLVWGRKYSNKDSLPIDFVDMAVNVEDIPIDREASSPVQLFRWPHSEDAVGKLARTCNDSKKRWKNGVFSDAQLRFRFGQFFIFLFSSTDLSFSAHDTKKGIKKQN